MARKLNIEEDKIDEFNTLMVGLIVKNRLVIAETMRDFMANDRVVRKLGDSPDQVRLAIVALETLDDYAVASMIHALLDDKDVNAFAIHDEVDFQIVNSLLKLGLKLAGQYNIADLQKIKYDDELTVDMLEESLMENFPEYFFEE